MSEATFKVSGWRSQGRPAESGELRAYRQLIRESIFAVYRRKKEILGGKGMYWPNPILFRWEPLEVHA